MPMTPEFFTWCGYMMKCKHFNHKGKNDAKGKSIDQDLVIWIFQNLMSCSAWTIVKATVARNAKARTNIQLYRLFCSCSGSIF